MTIEKISMEELARYRELRSKRMGKKPEPSTIIVDIQNMKNMQGMIPIQLWADIRSRAAIDMIPVKRILEIALETYLALMPEDFQRIAERFHKLEQELKEEE